MSCDSYYWHKVVMEVGNKPRDDNKTRVQTFKDDRELLAYLLEQERRDGQGFAVKEARAKSR